MFIHSVWNKPFRCSFVFFESEENVYENIQWHRKNSSQKLFPKLPEKKKNHDFENGQIHVRIYFSKISLKLTL